MPLSNEILRAAAEGLLRAYGSWCLKSLDVEIVKYLDTCQRAAKQHHKGGPACIIHNKAFASHVKHIACQQTRERLVLLSHVAWYFNGHYGLPAELFDPRLEIQCLSELYGLFETLHKSHTLPSDLFKFLQRQRGTREWARLKGQEGFKREVAGVILSLQKPLTDALESMV
jgi:hypothetical protein